MINLLDTNWEFENLTVNNLTVTGNLTMQNGDGNDTIQTNMITNVDNTTSINMDVGDTNTAINMTAYAVNTYGIASFSSSVNLNNANAVIGGYGNVTLTAVDALRITNNSGQGLYINNDKTSGDCIINSGSPASNAIIENGSLLINMPLTLNNVTSDYLVKACPSSEIYFAGSTSSTSTWRLSQNLQNISMPSFAISLAPATGGNFFAPITIILDVYIEGLNFTLLQNYNTDDIYVILNNEIPNSIFIGNYNGSSTSISVASNTFYSFSFTNNKIYVNAINNNVFSS